MLVPIKLFSKKRNKGFSLIELLLFVLFISTILLSLIFTTVYSIKNAQLSAEKLLAVRYAQEVQEWLRGEKEVDWNIFSNIIIDDATYCLSDIPNNITSLEQVNEGDECSSIVSTPYIRTLTINSINNDATRISYTVTIIWTGQYGFQSYLLDGTVSLWE